VNRHGGAFLAAARLSSAIAVIPIFLSMASLKSEASFALRIGKRTRGVRSVHRTIVQQNAETVLTSGQLGTLFS